MHWIKYKKNCLKGSLARVNRQKIRSLLLLHGMGKQLKDCDGLPGGERKIKKIVCDAQKNAPSWISEHHKGEFFFILQAMLSYALLCWGSLSDLKRRFFVDGHQISLKAECMLATTTTTQKKKRTKHLSVVKLKSKGSKRIFFRAAMLHKKKEGISLSLSSCSSYLW